ncbi:MAG: type I methionyl aminopeptidase [Candidatus Kerfeldbacteria bacterium]|jgi:methionyl aminopeptidase
MSLIKTVAEIKIIEEGGKILAEILNLTISKLKIGMSTMELDAIAQTFFDKSPGVPSFKNYEGFPAATCISVNDGVVHGIPKKDKILKDGDIVGIDLGLKYKGLYTDMAKTVPVGKITKSNEKLLSVTKKSLELGISQARPGNKIGDIGFAVQNYAEKMGFSVVRTLVGHGVGHEVHEEPRVPNFGTKGQGGDILEGMVLAIEPMLNIGKYDVETSSDQWTITTVDGSLSAHFEHTIAVTAKGAKVLTL